MLDLTVHDPSTNSPWDFSQASCRERAMHIMGSERPALLLGSPECPAATALQQSSSPVKDKTLVCTLLAQCVTHLQFLVKLYHQQVSSGRYFVHEHAAGNSSWLLTDMAKLMALPSILAVAGDVLLRGTSPQSKESVLTPPMWATNSPSIACELAAHE